MDLLVLIAAAKPQHRVSIDVAGDRFAYGVADCDCARIVHAAPDSGVVTVRARLRDAEVFAARLSGRRQGERLAVIELAEENGRRRSILTWVAGWILGVARRGDERFPVWIRLRQRIAVVPANGIDVTGRQVTSRGFPP